MDMDEMQDLDAAIEAFYYAHRALVARPDALLADHGLSRVHHRILFFVGRNPGLSVNDLLSRLGVCKQSVNIPMRKLLELKLIAAVPDASDRRIKRLELTESGKALDEELSGDQRRRLAHAFEAVGEEGQTLWLRVMQHLTVANGIKN
jgi:DNA-binding MarR family transcriptional regulator